MGAVYVAEIFTRNRVEGIKATVAPHNRVHEQLFYLRGVGLLFISLLTIKA
ncbi:MAG: hypothetical protein KME29_02740 [Calothrix sp. FI2-JRJ7]|jgi:hypothetical protein|nr:hypothetical protein [Calothrix sp. FI2-JRJ7]